MKAQEILEELNIEGEVLNIYPYGSHIYGTNTESSDRDYIIVMKAGILETGAFKNNAISNQDESIQGVVYSRGGFQDAINNYDMAALECLFLDDDLIIQKKWPYTLTKLIHKDMIKKVISKASNSWHIAKHQYQDGEIERSKKGVWHALRILQFGIQLVEHGAILEYNHLTSLKELIDTDEDFKPKNYLMLRDSLINKMKNDL